MKQAEQGTKQEIKLTGKDLLTAMNYLEDEWIETEQEKKEAKVMAEHTLKKKPMGRSAMKWAAAVAAAVLLLGGGVAYAASLGVFQFTASQNEKLPGYLLQVETERVLAEEFTGGVTEVKSFLLEQMAEENYSQKYPSWIKEYDSVEEARAYIGYAGLRETNVWGTPDEVRVRVIGTTDGELGEVALFKDYKVHKTQEIWMQETASIYTTECPFKYHGGGFETVEETDWKGSYRKEEYTTGSGRNAVLVFEEQEEGNRYLEGYLVDGAVFYHLMILYEPEDLEAAR
ncbi:MAG: hypothetical protein ACI4QX_08065, partial [Lachnospiraceae bacterium]